MTSAHSHPSGKAEFRLRKEGEQQKAMSKNIQLGPGRHRGLRVTLWASLALLRVMWGWLDTVSLFFSLNENGMENHRGGAAGILTDFTVCSHPAMWAVAGVTIGLVQAGAGVMAGVTVTFIDVDVTFFP